MGRRGAGWGSRESWRWERGLRPGRGDHRSLARRRRRVGNSGSDGEASDVATSATKDVPESTDNNKEKKRKLGDILILEALMGWAVSW